MTSRSKTHLTRRGRTVLITALLIAAFWFGTATASYCWNGSGYGSCIEQVNP